MKTKKMKKVIALILAVMMMSSVAVGCTIIEYQEDRDWRQVVIDINSYEMEYEVPFYIDAVKEDSDEVIYVDGEIYQKVQRDNDGDPVYVPVVEDGKVVYEKEEYSSSANKEIWYYSSARSYIVYEIEGNEAVSATVYYFDGFKNIAFNGSTVVTAECDYTPVWRNIDDETDVQYGESRKYSVQGDYTSSYVTTSPTNVNTEMPVICFSNDEGTDWEYYTADPEYVTDTWMTESNEYTKYTLQNYFNAAYDETVDAVSTLESQYKEVVIGLYKLELTYNESCNFIKSGDIEWELYEKNYVNQSFYINLDNAMRDLFEEIYSAQDLEYTGEEFDDNETLDGEMIYDEEYWEPDMELSLGMGTSVDRSSLIRRAFRELIIDLIDYIEDDYVISEATADEYTEQLEEIKERANDDNEVQAIYESLLEKDEDGEYTYEVMWYLYGDTDNRNALSTMLQDYANNIEEIRYSDVYNLYTQNLSSQMETFSDSDAFDSVIENDGTILYYPNDDYFYVKHILLPFSDEATETLEGYAASDITDVNYERLRLDLANTDNTEVFPVANNNDDVIRTADEAYADISYYVNKQSTLKEKFLAFDEMIEAYNTDPGMDESTMGYAVTSTSEVDGGPAETYMIEFADGARELREAYTSRTGSIGDMTQLVLTDYGYHILFLIKVPAAGEIVGMNDYLTAAEYSTAYEIFESNLTTVGYDSWVATTISAYEKANGSNTYFKINYSVYEDLIDIDEYL